MPDNQSQSEQPAQEADSQQVLATYRQIVDTIVSQGREDFGDASFDEMSAIVAEAFGSDNMPRLVVPLSQCEAPVRIVEHLAAHPERLAKLKGAPPARIAAELARIEAQLMPEGSGGGTEPAWVKRAKGGEKHGLGDDVDDKTWEKNFKKKYQNGLRPSRFG